MKNVKIKCERCLGMFKGEKTVLSDKLIIICIYCNEDLKNGMIF